MIGVQFVVFNVAMLFHKIFSLYTNIKAIRPLFNFVQFKNIKGLPVSMGKEELKLN